MKPYILVFILVFGLSFNYTVTVTSIRDTGTEESSYLITVDHERYKDKLLQSNDSWVLIFHRGNVEDSWKSLEKSIRGLAWLGTVDVKSETRLLKELGLEPSSVPPARVYPFGGTKQKLAEWQDVQNWREAQRFALKSIPADIPVLSSNNIEQFISESHESSTPRFPTLVLTESREITPVLRAIKHRFRRYFNIGMLVTPTVEELKKFGLDVRTPPDLPSLAVVIKQRQKTKQSKVKQQKPKFNPSKKVAEEKPVYITKAIPYSVENFGELSYSGVMRFFFSINHQFRYTLPEKSENGLKDTKIESMMSDVMDVEEDRFEDLFGRKMISSSQKSGSQSSGDKTDGGSGTKPHSGKPDKNASGGKCPFGFDKLSKNNPTEVKIKPGTHMEKQEL